MQTNLTTKEITIYYDDKSNSTVGRKDGTFLELTNNSIVLRNTNGAVEIIPLYRVIRIVEKNKWSG